MAYRERMKEYGAMYGLEKISNKCLPFGKKEACECHRLNVSFSFNCLHLLLHHVHHIKRTVATGLETLYFPLTSESGPAVLSTSWYNYELSPNAMERICDVFLRRCFLLPKLLYKESGAAQLSSLPHHYHPTPWH